MQSRRDFLKLMSAVASSGLTGVVGQTYARAEGQAQAGYKVMPWTGDDFTLGHRLRDAELPKFPQQADAKVDFVIVGAGMAGLSAAHYLKDENYLLLEQYDHTGGTSSGGSYRGINYSMGAVCTGSHDGIFGQLFDDLKMKPALIPPDQIGWHCDNKWFIGNSGSDKFYQELKRLTQETSALSNKMENSSAEDKQHTSAKLNSETFDKLLSSYDAKFVALISNICRSFYSADPSYVSALAGTFMMRALTSNSYVFEGGNSGIARALRKEIDDMSPQRVKTKCFVWKVEKKDSGASIVYTDSNGEAHRVDCRHAVVTTPPLVALRIAPELPDKIKNNFRQIEYAAFLVGNFCMKKKVFKNPYQSFADAPFPFGQMVLAEAPYEAMGKYKQEMGSVLTIYHPFEHGPLGRVQLLEKESHTLAESLIGELSKLVDEFRDNLEEVVFTRWGHAYIVPKAGTSNLMAGIQGLDPEWMTLAHSSVRGGPSLEGAVLAARYAADRCLAVKK